MSAWLTRPAATTRVLIVDDEVGIHPILTRWLTAEGYLCASASSVTEAISYLCTHEVHLVTSDVRMPGRTGLQLLSYVRQEFPDIAVLMLTASDDTQTAIEALTLGAYGYLIKPIVREELIVHARRALERRQLLIDNRQYVDDLEGKVRLQTAAIRSAHEETIHRLVTASLCRDEETGAHIRRTGLFSEILARALGWSEQEAELIRLAAPMHDVGKIGVRDSVLRKPGKLTPAEFDEMKLHSTIGAQILDDSPSPIVQMACEIANYHHERWDGTGYPSGISGEEIPEAARIVAIVDVYDALTHDRVYRPALPTDEVISILRNGSGTHFDPSILAAFFTVWDSIEAANKLNPDDGDAADSRIPVGSLNQAVVAG